MFVFQHKKAPWHITGGMLSRTQQITKEESIEPPETIEEADEKDKKTLPKKKVEEDEEEGVEEYKEGSTEPKKGIKLTKDFTTNELYSGKKYFLYDFDGKEAIIQPYLYANNIKLMVIIKEHLEKCFVGDFGKYLVLVPTTPMGFLPGLFIFYREEKTEDNIKKLIERIIESVELSKQYYTKFSLLYKEDIIKSYDNVKDRIKTNPEFQEILVNYYFSIRTDEDFLDVLTLPYFANYFYDEIVNYVPDDDFKTYFRTLINFNFYKSMISYIIYKNDIGNLNNNFDLT